MKPGAEHGAGGQTPQTSSPLLINTIAVPSCEALTPLPAYSTVCSVAAQQHTVAVNVWECENVQQEVVKNERKHAHETFFPG